MSLAPLAHVVNALAAIRVSEPVWLAGWGITLVTIALLSQALRRKRSGGASRIHPATLGQTGVTDATLHRNGIGTS